MSTASVSLIEVSRAEWATSKNLKEYYNVVYHCLTEIRFLKDNPKFDQSVQWTKVLEKSCDERIIRSVWSKAAMLHVISFDKTELTTNMAGNGRGESSKKKLELVLVALRI